MRRETRARVPSSSLALVVACSERRRREGLVEGGKGRGLTAQAAAGPLPRYDREPAALCVVYAHTPTSTFLSACVRVLVLVRVCVCVYTRRWYTPRARCGARAAAGRPLCCWGERRSGDDTPHAAAGERLRIAYESVIVACFERREHGRREWCWPRTDRLSVVILVLGVCVCARPREYTGPRSRPNARMVSVS